MANLAQAQDLGNLFEAVGRGVGLTVVAVPTDASRPIGHGIGPALEVRDVWAVLQNHADAPPDLREKALHFAGIILDWDPDVERGRERARVLLENGAALNRMERIVDLQGRKEHPIGPGSLAHNVLANQSGQVTGIDCYRVADIARRSGAPMDKGAGIDFLAPVGTQVKAGEPLYRILANIGTDLRLAVGAAERDNGIEIS